MQNINQTTAEQVKAYCARIGVDPLLVQGAGGNVSWKDGDILWVKASGTWLAHAKQSEIFIPVDFALLKSEIAKKNFSATPKLAGESKLRPSIETMLHALMPHKVVVHIHAVEVLAHMVRKSPLKEFKKIIAENFKSTVVDYFKPGADLAQAVSKALTLCPDADIVFMKSHGLVIGGDSVADIELMLNQLLLLLKITVSAPLTKNTPQELPVVIDGYVPCSDKEINLLAIKDEFISRLHTEWVLYPDHAVFLGADALIIQELSELRDTNRISLTKAPFIFCAGQGVYESLSASPAQKAQMRCYYDVLVRQEAAEKLVSLNKEQIAVLLDWDAEKYRSAISS